MASEDKAATSPDVLRNILHVFRYHPAAEKKRHALAKQIGVAETTITRWINQDSSPRHAQLEKISIKFLIDFEDFALSHEAFVRKVSLKYPSMDQSYRDTKPLVSLPAIAKWRFLWPEYAEKYSGTYLLYNLRTKQRGNDAPVQVAVSLLTIEGETDRGISFGIWNIDNENKDQPHIQYEYKGLLFPIFDVLCFYGDDSSGNEPIVMILRSSQTAPPSLMLGYLLAVNVRPEVRTPAAGKVVVSWQGSKIRSVSELEGRVGIFSNKEIPASILSELLA